MIIYLAIGCIISIICLNVIYEPSEYQGVMKLKDKYSASNNTDSIKYASILTLGLLFVWVSIFWGFFIIWIMYSILEQLILKNLLSLNIKKQNDSEGN